MSLEGGEKTLRDLPTFLLYVFVLDRCRIQFRFVRSTLYIVTIRFRFQGHVVIGRSEKRGREQINRDT